MPSTTMRMSTRFVFSILPWGPIDYYILFAKFFMFPDFKFN